jgi:hypothetical protein
MLCTSSGTCKASAGEGTAVGGRIVGGGKNGGPGVAVRVGVTVKVGVSIWVGDGEGSGDGVNARVGLGVPPLQPASQASRQIARKAETVFATLTAQTGLGANRLSTARCLCSGCGPGRLTLIIRIGRVAVQSRGTGRHLLLKYR